LVIIHEGQHSLSFSYLFENVQQNKSTTFTNIPIKTLIFE